MIKNKNYYLKYPENTSCKLLLSPHLAIIIFLDHNAVASVLQGKVQPVGTNGSAQKAAPVTLANV